MVVAIIDSGIDDSKGCGLKIKEDLVVLESGKVRPKKKQDQLYSTHGTECAKIIQENAKTEKIEFISLRVFQDWRLVTTPKRLVAALQWCYKKRIPMVHLSVGTVRIADFPEIRKIIRKMLAVGQKIVAALSNSYIYTVPACLPGVIGVQVENEKMKNTYSFQKKNRSVVVGQIEYVIKKSAWPQTKEWKWRIPCNSFAAAIVMGQIIERDKGK